MPDLAVDLPDFDANALSHHPASCVVMDMPCADGPLVGDGGTTSTGDGVAGSTELGAVLVGDIAVGHVSSVAGTKSSYAMKCTYAYIMRAYTDWGVSKRKEQRTKMTNDAFFLGGGGI